MDIILGIIILGVGGGLLAGIITAIAVSRIGKKSKMISSNIMTSNGYTVTKELGYLLIDEIHRKWTVSGYTWIFDYSDIIGISETQNGIKTKVSGGIGIGVTSGSVGIGVSTSRIVNTTISSWTIDISVRNSNQPLVQILLFSGSTIKVGDITYNSVNLLRNQYIAQLKQMQTAGSTAVPVTSTTPTLTRPHTIYTKVVGVTKLNDNNIQIQIILPTLNDGCDLILVREPNNPYDKNAIKVIADYQHIGYIRSELAQQLAPLMDQGSAMRAEVKEITGGGSVNYGCNIAICIQ